MNDSNLDTLQRGFQEAPSPGVGREQVEDGQIWAAATGELPPEEFGELLDIVVRSPEVTSAWLLAREIQSEFGPPLAGSRERPAARRGFRIWLLAAAAVLLVFVMWPWVGREPFRVDPLSVERGSDTTTLESLVQENASLPRQGLTLRWEPLPDPQWRYDVRLWDEDLKQVDAAYGLTATEYSVNPELLSQFASGSRLLWRVTAIHPDGRRITSTTFVVQIE